MATLSLATARPVALFGEPQLQADGDLLALTFAPDGTLWSVEEPGVLRHWLPPNGQQISWRPLSDLEMVWTFSRDARILASANDELTLWDAASGQILTALPQPAWVTAVAFAADSGFVATGHDDGVIRYWDAAGHHLIHEWSQHGSDISALAFNQEGGLLAAAGEDRVISLWDVRTGKLLGLCEGHTDRIPALAWHPGGNFLVTAGWDHTARVWNILTREPVILLNNHAEQVTALAFNPDGSRLASADSSSTIQVWDFAASKPLRVLQGAQGDIGCLAFMSDGKTLACSGARMIHLWDGETGQDLASGGPRSLARTSLALARDGTRLVTNAGGAAPCLWNLDRRQGLPLPSDHAVHEMALSPDGKLIAGACVKYLRLWDAQTGQVVLDCQGPERAITVVAFSQDSRLVASAGSTGIDVWLWRVQDGEPILVIPDALDNCTIESLAFHPDGRRLAVGGIDWLATGGSSGAVSLWDLDERCEVATFPCGATAIAFHPSGQRLAFTSTDQSICIWDLDDQQLLAEVSAHAGAIACLAYSPDGHWLASGGEDRTLRLWNPDGEEEVCHELHSQITGLTFAADGRSLFAAHANTTCSQFRVDDLLK